MLFTAAANQVPVSKQDKHNNKCKHSGAQQPGRMHCRLYECVRANIQKLGKRSLVFLEQ